MAGGRNAGGLNGGLLGIFPVVVAHRDKAGRAVELEHWVSQDVRNTEPGERWTDRANEHVLRRVTRDDEAADAGAVTGLHPHASGEIDGLRRNRARRRGGHWSGGSEGGGG